MIEVIGLPAHVRRHHTIDLVRCELGLGGDVELHVDGEAVVEHYDFDDEGPDVEGEDWAEEGSGLGEAEGRHVGGGFEVRHCDNSRVNVCGSEAVISR